MMTRPPRAPMCEHCGRPCWYRGQCAERQAARDAKLRSLVIKAMGNLSRLDEPLPDCTTSCGDPSFRAAIASVGIEHGKRVPEMAATVLCEGCPNREAYGVDR